MRTMIGTTGALAALLMSVAAPVGAQDDPRVAAAFARLPQWRKSVVVLRVTCAPGDVYEGVGVLVRSTGEVLSAAHVGSHCLDRATASVGIIRSPYSAPGEDLTATLKGRIADNVTAPSKDAAERSVFQDLALWKVDSMVGSGLVPAELAKGFPVAGDPVEIVGFANLPFGHRANGTAGEHSGTGITRYRTWITSVGATKVGNVPYRLHYPGFTLQGLSGGPVFNAAGEVIGIHSGRSSRGISAAIYSGCDTAKPNCVAVRSPDGAGPGTIGIDVDQLKTMLDNYSWATSVLALPAGWLP